MIFEVVQFGKLTNFENLVIWNHHIFFQFEKLSNILGVQIILKK